MRNFAVEYETRAAQGPASSVGFDEAATEVIVGMDTIPKGESMDLLDVIQCGAGREEGQDGDEVGPDPGEPHPAKEAQGLGLAGQGG